MRRVSALGFGARVVVGLLVCGLLTLGVSLAGAQNHLTAWFPSTINLYPGAQVKVLGVRMGTVDSVRVVGTRVRVRISYDPHVDLPADVHAAIVPPSIVGDRFVQLAPAYDGGPKLRDRATIGLRRSAVPVELDQTYRQLDALSQALGPNAADQDGTLGDLVGATARTLDGNGARFHDDLSRLSDALDTLGRADPAYQSTIANVGAVTSTLKTDDDLVRKVVLALVRVSQQLAAQRQDIASSSRQLDRALADVARFTRTNRATLTSTLSSLREVTTVLRQHLRDLDDLLALAPVGFTDAMNINFPTNYDPANPGTSTPAGRSTSYLQRGLYTENLNATLSTVLSQLCQTATGSTAAQLGRLCTALAAAGNDLGLVLTQVTTMQTGGQQPTFPQLLAQLQQGAASRKGSGR